MSPTVVFGRPGGFASSLARRAAVRVVLLWLGAMAAFAGAAALSGGEDVSPVVWLLLVVSVAAVVAARRAGGRLRRAAVGARSERRVARVLRRMGPAAVVHGGLLGGGGDADHVVLGPLAVVVETKTGSGPLRLRDGEMVVGGRRIPGDPVAQVLRQSRLLAAKAGVAVAAVVCVPDLVGRPREMSGVTVCSLADLPATLATLPRVLSPGRACEVACQIDAEVFERRTPAAR